MELVSCSYTITVIFNKCGSCSSPKNQIFFIHSINILILCSTLLLLFEVIFIHFSVNKVSSLGVHFEDNLLLNCKRLSLGKKLLSSRYLFKCNSYCLTSESSAHTSIALSCFALLLHLFQVTQGGLGMNCRCCVLPDTELISGTRFNTLVEALLNGRGLTL